MRSSLGSSLGIHDMSLPRYICSITASALFFNPAVGGTHHESIGTMIYQHLSTGRTWSQLSLTGMSDTSGSRTRNQPWHRRILVKSISIRTLDNPNPRLGAKISAEHTSDVSITKRPIALQIENGIYNRSQSVTQPPIPDIRYHF